MDRTCRTCDWWNNHDGVEGESEEHECNHEVIGELRDENCDGAPPDGVRSDRGYGPLWMGPRYGCIHWMEVGKPAAPEGGEEKT